MPQMQARETDPFYQDANVSVHGIDGERKELNKPQPVAYYGAQLSVKDCRLAARIQEQSGKIYDGTLPNLSIDASPACNSSHERSQLPHQAKLLESSLSKHYKSDLNRQFYIRLDMLEFEKRALTKVNGMSPDEPEKTYEQVNKLLNSNQNAILSKEEILDIAEQIIHQAAYPNQVRQGQANTCSVASIESRIYARYPSAAAKFVVEAATGGAVELANGSRVLLPQESLSADNQSSSYSRDDGYYRSHASQIFQLSAVNSYYDQINKSSNGNTLIRYEITNPAWVDDSGERLYDYADSPDYSKSSLVQYLGNSPEIPLDKLEELSNLISGKAESGFVLADESVEVVTGNFSSANDLSEKLARLKQEEKLPVIVWVDATNAPFSEESMAGEEEEAGSHVLTISDYEKRSKLIYADNQWDQDSDIWIDLDDFYSACQKTEEK